MGWEYHDDRVTQRQNLESAHGSVFYATGEVDVLGDAFTAAVALLSGTLTVADAIRILQNAGKGAEMVAWLTKQGADHHFSCGTVRYTFWWRYRNGPIRTPWNVKGYKIQGWIAID